MQHREVRLQVQTHAMLTIHLACPSRVAKQENAFCLFTVITKVTSKCVRHRSFYVQQCTIHDYLRYKGGTSVAFIVMIAVGISTESV